MEEFLERNGESAFWVGAGLVLLVFFSGPTSTFTQTFYFVSSLLPVAIATSYYFNNFLLPEYLIRQRYGYFVFYTFCMIIFSLYAQSLVIILSLFIFSFYQMAGANHLTLNLSSLNLMIFLIVVINGFIKILKLNGLKETQASVLEEQLNQEEEKTITVRYNRTNYPIKLNSILYIESMADYVKIIVGDTEVVTKQKISHLQQELPGNFLRTHRSYIINKDQVTSYNKEYLSIRDHQIPLSRTYKKDVLAVLAA